MADPKAAATNFLNALEKIPGIIAQRKEKNEALAKEIPQLQEIAGKVWKKEDELKQLKSELCRIGQEDSVGTGSICSECGSGRSDEGNKWQRDSQ